MCYYFYKNIILVFTEIYFVFFNGFSGQIYFAEWLPTLYNALWTSLTCLFAFAFENDTHDPRIDIEHTKLFKIGQWGKYFSILIFWKWVLQAFYQGCVIFWMTHALAGPVDSTGKTSDHWYISSIAFTCVIHLVTLKLILETINLNIIYLAMVAICLISYYAIVLFLNANDIAITMQP